MVATTILAATLSDAARVPEVGALGRGFYDDRLRRAEPIISRAIARGELPPDTDPAEVVKTMIAPIYLRLLITAEPIDATTADRAAQLAVTAARRHPAPSAEPPRHMMHRSIRRRSRA